MYRLLIYLFPDHDEERFLRAIDVDRNGVKFNVVFDPEDSKYYWLMIPIQLSPIPGLNLNLNNSNPFATNKNFMENTSVNKTADSGVDAIMANIPMPKVVAPLNSKPPKKSSPSECHLKVPDSVMGESYF